MIQSQGNSDERRKFPRLSGNIPVKICGDDFDAVTETQNVSRAGAFCRVENYIEPMTKLKVQLLLSVRKGKRLQTKKVACDGVVVRTEPVDNNEKGYYVAIFFNDISEKDANAISDFIQAGMTKDQKEKE